jgi:hypothetical protein
VALVAVVAARGGLVPVAGVRVHGGDDPVLGDPPGDPEASVVVLLDVLADHRGEQLGGLGDAVAQLPALQHRPRGVAVADQRVDQQVTRAWASSQSHGGLPAAT